MKKVNVFDEAQLRHEFRALYRDIGEQELYQVLYELLRSAEILCEVVRDEMEKK